MSALAALIKFSNSGKSGKKFLIESTMFINALKSATPKTPTRHASSIPSNCVLPAKLGLPLLTFVVILVLSVKDSAVFELRKRS